MPREKADPQALMLHGRTCGQRFRMAVQRRIHIELRLQLLRREIRNGVTEVEIVGEMLPLAAEKFILRRRLEIRGNRPLCIGKRPAARPHHL